MDWRPISADSHITEPPNCYVDHIDPAWRERAPHVIHKTPDYELWMCFFRDTERNMLALMAEITIPRGAKP